MALIGVIFMIFSIVMSSTIRTSSEVGEDAVLQGEVRSAVDGLAKDLRQASTGNGTAPLEKMTATEIQFFSPDRATPYHLRRINYKLSGKTLKRASSTSTNTGAPPWTFPASLSVYSLQVGSIVNSDIFKYYNAADPPVQTTDPTDVASVSIKIVVATKGSPNRQFTYATSVALRVAQ